MAGVFARRKEIDMMKCVVLALALAQLSGCAVTNPEGALRGFQAERDRQEREAARRPLKMDCDPNGYGGFTCKQQR